MSISKLTVATATLSASLFFTGALLHAQDAPPAASPTPSTSPTPQAGGAQDFLQQMLSARDLGIKTTLKVPDDEWAVIQPLLDKVEKAQFAVRVAGMSNFGGRGPGGPGGGGPGGPGGPGGNGGPGGAGGPGAGFRALFQPSQESQALSEAVASDSTSNDDLKAKMAAVRAARKKADDDLAAARAELQKVLSVREEAALLNMGILD